jgi:hypothetical protein
MLDKHNASVGGEFPTYGLGLAMSRVHFSSTPTFRRKCAYMKWKGVQKHVSSCLQAQQRVETLCLFITLGMPLVLKS